jgi:hypothetical protein
LDKARKNQRSTKPTLQPDTQPTAIDDPHDNDAAIDHAPPQQATKTHSVCVAYALADIHQNVIYTDLTGAFPHTSQAGNKYILILYKYDSNSILAEPMRNRSDAEALRVYEKLYNELTADRTV